MTAKEKRILVDAWITSAQAESDSADYTRNLWASKKLDDLISVDSKDGEEAEIAFSVILAILDRLLPGKALALLAAGPLEDLLVHHGSAFIDRVEERARLDPVFNELLGGVWQNAMSDAIWERIQVTRNSVW